MTAVSGRGWAYVGVTLGAVVSLAANVAHSFVPPAGASPGWTPAAGSVVSAVCWPLLLLVAVEMFARITWPAGRGWLLLRWLGLLPVALIAAVVSYRHLSGLLAWYGEDWLTYTFGPLAVDGLMVMATGALVGRRRAGPRSRDSRTGVQEPARARTGTPNQPLPGVREDTGTPGRTIRRTDAQLLQVLGKVTREADGTVPVRRAAKALGTGPDRARRLLREAGLLRSPAAMTAAGMRPDDATGDPAEPAVLAREPEREALR